MKSDNQKFLMELADLQDKYGIAICATTKQGDLYAEIAFQAYENTGIVTIDTNRCHATGHEIRLIAGDIGE